MPRIISANTHGTTVMIGERVADFIKQRWYNDSNKKEEL